MSWIVSGTFKNKLLLDEYPDAAAAYSLRNLTILSDTPVVRVRRDSDNTEQDFTARQVTDGTLTTFCGAGNGFVRTWYDQSGKGRHLIQTGTSNQPTIVANGVLETEGGAPRIRCTQTTNQLSASVSYSSVAHSVFKVCRVTSGERILTLSSEQAVYRRRSYNNAYEMYGAGVNNQQVVGFPATRLLLSGFWAHSDGDVFGYSNGANIISNTTGPGGTASINAYIVGGIVGSIQEIISYSSNQISNRVSIESNINAYYAIY